MALSVKSIAKLIREDEDDDCKRTPSVTHGVASFASLIDSCSI
jgi:hypothetical protein